MKGTLKKKSVAPCHTWAPNPRTSLKVTAGVLVPEPRPCLTRVSRCGLVSTLPSSPASLRMCPPRMLPSDVAWRLCCSLRPEHSSRRYPRGLLLHLREVFVPRSLQGSLLKPPICKAPPTLVSCPVTCLVYLCTRCPSDIFFYFFFLTSPSLSPIFKFQPPSSLCPSRNKLKEDRNLLLFFANSS